MKLIRNIFKLSQHKKFKFVYNMGSNFHKFSASAVVINNKFLPVKKFPLGVKVLIHLVLKVPPFKEAASLQFLSIMKDSDLKNSAGFTKAARL